LHLNISLEGTQYQYTTRFKKPPAPLKAAHILPYYFPIVSRANKRCYGYILSTNHSQKFYMIDSS